MRSRAWSVGSEAIILDSFEFRPATPLLEAGEFDLKYSPQAGVNTGPSDYAFSFPAKMREEYLKQWHAEHDPRLGKEPVNEDVFYNGHDWDDVRPHMQTFFQAVRSRKPVTEDAVFGNNAAIACHIANESYFRKKPVTWDTASKTIKSYRAFRGSTVLFRRKEMEPVTTEGESEHR